VNDDEYGNPPDGPEAAFMEAKLATAEAICSLIRLSDWKVAVDACVMAGYPGSIASTWQSGMNRGGCTDFGSHDENQSVRRLSFIPL